MCSNRISKKITKKPLQKIQFKGMQMLKNRTNKIGKQLMIPKEIDTEQNIKQRPVVLLCGGLEGGDTGG